MKRVVLMGSLASLVLLTPATDAKNHRATLKGIASRNLSLFATDDFSGDVPSYIIGTVSSISVTVGQSVKKGTELLVIEAMKIPNSIQSPRDGVVKEIRTFVGARVNVGDVLIVLE